uniref:Flagellar protein FlbD n=1 Tax=Thermorudis sp. TaxID=1969470 RepID=A0A7C2WR91_9BACT
MIELTRFDGSKFVLNALLIETIEAHPDTVITLTTGKHYVVREPVEHIVARVIAFHSTIHRHCCVQESACREEAAHG